MTKALGTLTFDALTDEQRFILGVYFSAFDEESFAKGVHTFTYEGETYTFELPSAVLRRPRAHRRGYVYEVVSNEKLLGGGAFGKVIKIESTGNEAIDQTLSFEKKARVLKQQSLTNENQENRTIPWLNEQELASEFELTHLAGYLHVKKPVLSERSFLEEDAGKSAQLFGHMVMRHLGGKEFCGIQKDDVAQAKQQQRLMMTLDQRIRIAINLLCELVKLHKSGVIHRDLKPENILINVETGEVKILDFGLSKKKGEQDLGYVGTAWYCPPEQIPPSTVLSGKQPFPKDHGQNTTEQSDGYALGIILGELFLLKNTADDYSKAAAVYNHRRAQRTQNKTCPIDFDFKAYFKNLGLSQVQQDKIEKTLKQMTEEDLGKRAFPKDAIPVFEEIRLERTLATLAKDSEKENVKFANERAKLAKDQIKKLSIPKQLTTIHNYLCKVADTPAAMSEFFETLNIQAFRGIQSKQAFLDKCTVVCQKLMELIQQEAELIKKGNDLDGIIEALKKVGEYDKALVYAKLREEVDYILDQKSKTFDVTIDGMLQLNARLAKTITEIRAKSALVEKTVQKMDAFKDVCALKDYVKYGLALYIVDHLSPAMKFKNGGEKHDYVIRHQDQFILEATNGRVHRIKDAKGNFINYQYNITETRLKHINWILRMVNQEKPVMEVISELEKSLKQIGGNFIKRWRSQLVGNMEKVLNHYKKGYTVNKDSVKPHSSNSKTTSNPRLSGKL